MDSYAEKVPEILLILVKLDMYSLCFLLRFGESAMHPKKWQFFFGNNRKFKNDNNNSGSLREIGLIVTYSRVTNKVMVLCFQWTRQN